MVIDLKRRGVTKLRWSRSVSDGGFTLIELLIVIAVIGIITAVAMTAFRQTPQKAKEAALKQDLFVLRDVIDQYFADKGAYPDSLETLVDEGYIRRIPIDPMTDSDQTWMTEEADFGDEPDSGGGIADVHSGSDETALDGTRYSEW